MKKLLFLSIVILAGRISVGQTPTWAEDIAPILYNNCTSCHHSGGLAPFSLITYSDAQNNKNKINDEVLTRKMPPWPPDPFYSRLAHERILSASDIQKISAWAADGAPAGNLANAPTPPTYDNGSVIGIPDLTITIPTYTVPSNQTKDIYQCFAIPSALLQDKFITAMEIIPGDPSIVHHVLVYQDTSGTCAQLDAAAAGPGYSNFGGVGTNKAILVGGWVPGTMPYFLPTNMGIKLHKNTDLVLQIHYPKGSQNKKDSTKINLKLSTNVSRQVSIAPILNHYLNINTPLSIPPNTVKTFTEHYKIPNLSLTDFTMLTVGPHAHLIAQQWLVYGVTPVGDTIPIIRINDWDFHWQGFYPFKNLMKFPKGTDLYAICKYDNTVNNPHNPNSPPKTVNVGEATTDEMMLVYFSYTSYVAGDENIKVDTSTLIDLTELVTSVDPVKPEDYIVSTPQLYEPAPNPSNGETWITYFLPESVPVMLEVYDLNGRLIEKMSATNSPGFNKLRYESTKLQSGTYLLRLISGATVRSKPLVISR